MFHKIKEKFTDYLEEKGIDTSHKVGCINPEHNDSNPSAKVYDDHIYCFGCGESYDIFDASAIFEGLPARGEPGFFKHNVTFLAKKYGIPLPSWSESKTLDIYSTILKYIEETVSEDILKTTVDSLDFSPLQKKGHLITISSVDVDIIIHMLLDKGFTNDEIRIADITAKLFPKKSTYIYPLYIKGNVVVGFMTKNPYGKPKYMNSENNSSFTKGSFLYGLENRYSIKKPLYIVEGQKDALALIAKGYQAVALLSTSLTKNQYELIKEFTNIIICLDGDEPGQNGSLKIAEFLLKQGIVSSIVTNLEESEDPYDFFIVNKKENLETIDALTYITNNLEIKDPLFLAEYFINIFININSHIKIEILIDKLSKIINVKNESILKEIEHRKKEQELKLENDVIQILEKGMFQAKTDPDHAIKFVRDAVEYASSVTSINTSFDNSYLLSLLDGIESGSIDRSHLDIPFREDGLYALYKALHEGGTGYTGETLIVIGGDSHTGKTLLLIQAGVEFLIGSKDSMVIHFSTDDSSRILLPRFISSMVFNPSFHINEALSKDLTGAKKLVKEKSSQLFQQWAKNERLIMLDQNFSNKLSKLHDLIKYYRDKYPERRIMVINDNFHRNGDYVDKDKNTKMELMSNDAKGIAVTEDITFWAAVEYRKNKSMDFSRNKRALGPVNADIAGDRALVYHASMIINLYNDYIEQNCDINSCLMAHQYKGTLLPRVNATISKNKITGDTGVLSFDLYPFSSFAKYVDPVTAQMELEERTELLKRQGKLQ